MDTQSTTLDMDVVKQEENIAVCYCCFSQGRALSELGDNVDLFLYLLGPHGPSVDPNSIFLCWECTAILRKMRRFQFQVQSAQIAQQSFYDKDVSLGTLSNLSLMKFENLNLTMDDNERKENNFLVVNSHSAAKQLYTAPTDDIKPIPVNENIHTITSDKEIVIHFKQEDEDYEENIGDYGLDASEPETNEIKEEKCSEKQKKLRNYTPHKKFEKRAKITKNPDIDVKNYNSFFFKTTLSEADIDGMGKFVGDKKIKHNCYLYCEMCKILFETGIDLKRHKTYHHILKDELSGPSQCLKCKAKCPDHSSLKTHWIQHHNTIMKCKYCDARMFWVTSMKAHAESHEYLWTCKMCVDMKVVFMSYREFGYHVRAIHKRATCDYCGHRSKSKQSIMKHIKMKHTPPICVICNKQFKDSFCLRRHNLCTHPEVEDKKVDPELTYCVECNKQFPSEAKYRLHLATTVAHNPAKVKARKLAVPCPECGKQFSRKTYMNNHYRQIHQKESKHYCALCDKYLVTAWSMKVHIQGVHQKIRDPKTKVCDLCGRAFGTNAILVKHLRTHTGERPYRCAHCPAAFSQNCALKSHTRTQHKALI